ncbi:MAG TPA: septal ring lytic transglycosylase RlpA family protein [Solirubrobacteraceae bacterium]|jgi:hypothetical protein
MKPLRATTLLATLVAFALPAAAQAQTGGASPSSPPPSSSPQPEPAPAQPQPQPQSTGGAPAPQPAPLASPDATAGAPSTLTGLADPGEGVAIERLVRKTGVWKRIATATAGADGTFTATWTPKRAGQQRMRVVPAGTEASAASAPAEVAITVYRSVVASYYGPGFYGRRTACGYRMSKALIGVAHKKLPCGTQVALRYGGREMIVPVVDRGPYRPGRTYDLTAATAFIIAFGGLDRIDAVARKDLPRAAAPARPAKRHRRRR